MIHDILVPLLLMGRRFGRNIIRTCHLGRWMLSERSASMRAVSRIQDPYELFRLMVPYNCTSWYHCSFRVNFHATNLAYMICVRNPELVMYPSKEERCTRAYGVDGAEEAVHEDV